MTIGIQVAKCFEALRTKITVIDDLLPLVKLMLFP